jgi:lysozyme family protein
MASFNIFTPILLAVEGGYTNHPNDNGNWTGGKKGAGQLVGTNHGISAAVLGAWLKRTATVADMKALTKATALQIYRKNYWDAMRASEIVSQSVANLFVDFGVNSGPSVAVREMQEVLNDVFGKSLKEDGEIGPKTLQAINSVNSELLFEAYKKKRLDFYKALNQPTFYNGWVNRLKSFVYEKKK